MKKGSPGSLKWATEFYQSNNAEIPVCLWGQPAAKEEVLFQGLKLSLT